jgi:HSP20 family protein
MKNDANDDPFAGGIGPRMRAVDADETDRVDVHEYETQVTVVTDIPGVEEDAVDLQCDGRTLAIHAATETRSFGIRVALPAYVDADSMDRTLNNGVLEVTLTKDRDPADIGFR